MMDIDQPMSTSLAVEDEAMDVVNKPCIGMVFNSEQDAYDFYNSYVGRKGFSVRREYANKSRKDKTTITSRRFVCNKHGSRRKDKRDVNTNNPRAQTRTECEARMGIIIMKDGKYQCSDFVENHNHELHVPGTTHMMRSQRSVSEVHGLEIVMADESGIKPKGIFEYMSRQAGGRENLGFTKLDQLNYIRTKRQRDLDPGEAGSLLFYFQEQSRLNPSFTYSVQLDNEEHITNIFWADSKMIIDYELFGDVITFDTTFSTNKAYRPFGLFAGFNHHRGAVIFGAALLYDETADSFKWLFETFLRCHGGKKPITIFTDQDKAMSNAIREKLPETVHGLCTWHLMQNGITHLGNLMKDGSSFLSDLKKCMYEYDDEDLFENAWHDMRAQYLVEDGSWLDHIYEIKHKWAKCHMKKTLTLGMRSTQLSESLNADLKDHLKCTHAVPQFFHHFERVVNEKRANELKSEFDARNKLPRNKFPMTPIMVQAGNVYTPRIFDEFQEEYLWVGACYINFREESNDLNEYKYEVAILNKEGKFDVYFSPAETLIRCSCRKFESFGILCCHALKVLDVLDIKYMHDSYILSRWTRAARNNTVLGSKGKQVEEDVDMGYTQRYRILCPQYISMVSHACHSADGYKYIRDRLADLCKGLQSITTKAPHDNAPIEDPNLNKVKGLKRKKRGKPGRRVKGWVEEVGKRRKKVSTTATPMSTQSVQSIHTLPKQTVDTTTFTGLLGSVETQPMCSFFPSQASTTNHQDIELGD